MMTLDAHRMCLTCTVNGAIMIYERRYVIMAPKVSTFTERVAVFFTPEQLEKIKAEAEKQGLPVSVFIRMATLKAVNE